jgi:hypothetical protein
VADIEREGDVVVLHFARPLLPEEVLYAAEIGLTRLQLRVGEGTSVPTDVVFAHAMRLWSVDRVASRSSDSNLGDASR